MGVKNENTGQVVHIREFGFFICIERRTTEIGPLLVLFIPLFYLWIVWVLDFFVNDDLDAERGNSTVWLIRFLLSVGFIIALIIAWLSGDPNAGFYDY